MKYDELVNRLNGLENLLEGKTENEPAPAGEAYRTALLLCREARDAAKSDSPMVGDRIESLHRYVSDSLPWTDDVLNEWDKVRRLWRTYSHG